MIKRLLLTLTATLACLATTGWAQISVTGTGAGPFTFDTAPEVTEWSTRNVAGGGGDVTTGPAMDLAVDGETAAAINTPLGSATGLPPAASANAQYASDGKYLITRPTGVKYHVIMATLRNDSGAAITDFKLEYDLTVQNTVTEELQGHRVYVSTTGASPWANVSALNGNRISGHKLADIDLSGTPWAATGLLYVLWTDDNGSGSPDDALEIDNVKFSIPPPNQPPIITAQPVGVTNVEGSVVSLNVVADGSPPLKYQWFKGVNLIPDATNATLVVTNTAGSGLTISVPSDSGSYKVVVTGKVNPTATSSTVLVKILADTNAPIAEFANVTAVAGEVVVNLSKSLSDTTADVTNLTSWAIELSGGANLTITNITHTPGSPRVHIFAAEAIDPVNSYSVLNTLALPDRAFTPNFLPANSRLPILATSNNIASVSQVWKYSDIDVDLPANWTTAAYNDTGAEWKSGPGPFDAKSSACRATTLYGLGAVGTCLNMLSPGTTTDLPTVYYRTLINLPVGGGSNALLRLQGKVDDGAVIYLNGVEIGRIGMAAAPAPVTRASLANRTVGDGDAQDVVDLFVPNMFVGNNLLAIEAHQANLTSSDITMGFEISVLTGGAKIGPRLTLVTDPSNPGAFSIVWTGQDRLQAAVDLGDPNGWFDINEGDYRGLGPNGSNSYQVLIEPTQPRFFFRTVK